MDKHLLVIGGWTEILEKALQMKIRVSYFGSFVDTPAFDSKILVAFFLRDLIIMLNLRKIFHKYFLQNILVV